MAEDIGSLVVRIEANLKNFESGMNNITEKVNGFGNTVKKIGGIIAGAFIVKEIGSFFKSTIEDAAEAESNLSQLNTVLESTGGKAGVTAKQVTDLASSLQKSTKFSDDAIIAGDNLLLTFTSIGKDVFPAATETMLNMSQALGQDIKGSAIQLGKALNDPINGVTALRRVGVSFTESQMEQIKTMQESGNIMGAQKLILKELETEFGGAAKAAGETFSGKLERLKNQFGEIKESIGGALMPILSNLAEWFIDNTPQIQAFVSDAIDKAKTSIDNISKVALPLLKQGFEYFTNNILPALKDGFNGFKDSIKFVIDNFNIFGPILAGIIAGFVAYHAIMKIAKIVTATMTTAQWLLNAAMNANPLGIVVLAIGALIAIGLLLYKNWDTIKEKLGQFWRFFKAHWDKIVAFAGPIGLLIAVGVALYKNWDTIKEKAVELWQKIKETFSGIGSWFKERFTEVWTSIKEVFAHVGTFFGGIWDTIKNKFVSIGTKIGSAFGGAFKTAMNAVLSTIENTINDFFHLINKATNIINKIPGVEIGKIKDINIPQFEKGTNFVPFDTMAFLHKGEAVVPADNNPSNSSASNPVGQSINYEGMFNGAVFNIRSDNDVKMLAREFYNLTTSRNRGSGVVPAT